MFMHFRPYVSRYEWFPFLVFLTELADVFFQLASGQLPYPNRTNDHAVTVDILRGVKPSRSETCLLKLDTEGEDAFWNMLGQGWNLVPTLRPSMPHMLSFLEVLEASQRMFPPMC